MNRTVAKQVSRLGPIFGVHIKRISVIRTFAGGLPMYLCIPLLIICHTTVAMIFYQWLLWPILGTKRVRWKDYNFTDLFFLKASGTNLLSVSDRVTTVIELIAIASPASSGFSVILNSGWSSPAATGTSSPL
jgi:hypothetical protein